MTAGRFDLEAFQGDDFSVAITIADDSGTPLDVRGRTYRAQIRTERGPGGKLLATFGTDTSDAIGGVVVLTLSAGETAAMADGVWDLEEHGAEIRTLLVGRFRCIAGVSRD
jgi:hypothetical protein